jgi:hypothetical protein
MATKQTRLDKDTTKPSVTQPGDGPADTTDPTERASSAPVRPGEEALKVGTVNAVQPMPDTASDDTRSSKKNQRVEKYQATKPDGTEVTVTHNIDTGETSVA